MRISDWSSDVCSSDLPAGSLAKRSIDDVAPNGAIPRNAATGSSGPQDALSYKERLRGAKDPTDERSGELARRESRIEFGARDQRRHDATGLVADSRGHGRAALGTDRGGRRLRGGLGM